jgi:VWFA-related protein
MGAREGMKPGGMDSTNCRHRWGWAAIALLLTSLATATKAQDTGSRTTGQSGTPPAPSQTQSPPIAPAKDSPTPAAAKSNDDSKSEVSSRDTGTTFKLRVNLVQVHVVVRDRKGDLVNGLKKEDFQLFDQGKLQVISTFGVETPKSRLERAEAAAKTQQQENATETPADRIVLPERFVALLFDDIHLNQMDAVAVRTSAKALIDSLTPTDRMGIFGTSEQVKQEFTNDKEQLERTLLQIVSRPKMGKVNSVTNCPDVNHYMADEYVNKQNSTIFNVVTQETLQCQFQGNPQMLSAAQALAESSLRQALVAGDTDNDFTYRALEDAIRRMTGLPGERVMVLASPGFLLTTRYLDEMGIIDRANRAGVVINTLDARGLYTPDVMPDVSQHNTDTIQTGGFKTTYRTQEQFENEFVLTDFANGTGGTFFHNSNDLAGGLKQLGAAPEISYVLGFSPQNQKMDGKYHTIKVTLVDKQKYSIQARRGYYAPKKVDDPQQQAKQEIAEAVFSQEEIHDLSLDLQTQYFKTGDAGAQVSVVSRIDVKGMPFRKSDGRNWDNLTVATVIFDENGNYVTGGEKLLEMRLLDTTYARLSKTGLTMKSSFQLKAGKYMVRQVIRDSEGAQMAARNGALVIPY